ncbi:hypothetical protein P8452_63803 [Trifolium repens]|nr:hypothetical protein P8452_63803 [Trifolium repens]
MSTTDLLLQSKFNFRDVPTGSGGVQAPRTTALNPFWGLWSFDRIGAFKFDLLVQASVVGFCLCYRCSCGSKTTSHRYGFFALDLLFSSTFGAASFFGGGCLACFVSDGAVILRYSLKSTMEIFSIINTSKWATHQFAGLGISSRRIGSLLRLSRRSHHAPPKLLADKIVLRKRLKQVASLM